MRPAPPVLVLELFPDLLQRLLGLLDDLTAEEWACPTPCPGWSVKDVALHLLGGDVGILSVGRDHLRPSAAIEGWDSLVNFINDWNARWVQAARRMSPRLVRDMLAFTGPQVIDHFRSLDPFAAGNVVSWAGPAPAPVWLDLAREYTERWHHQQHIRAATGRPGAAEPRYLAPVLATFVRALPYSYRNTSAPPGTQVVLHLAGAAGESWTVVREASGWRLYAGAEGQASAEVTLPEDVAWQLWTSGLARAEARQRATMTGDQALAEPIFDMIAIIA